MFVGAGLTLLGLATIVVSVVIDRRQEAQAVIEITAARTDPDPEHAVATVGRWQATGRLEPGAPLAMAAALALDAAADRIPDRSRARIIYGAAVRFLGGPDSGPEAIRIAAKCAPEAR